MERNRGEEHDQRRRARQEARRRRRRRGSPSSSPARGREMVMAVIVVVLVAVVVAMAVAAVIVAAPCEAASAAPRRRPRRRGARRRASATDTAAPGRMNWESARVTIPMAKTPAVCATVTVPPSMTACRGVPRVPTRYAATSAFPCPGVSACAAPQNAATRRETASTPSDSSPCSMRASKPPPSCAGACASPRPGGAPGDSPGSIAAVARRTSSGERSRSFGYARSPRLSLISGTSEPATPAPSRADSVTSRQPMRPGNERSRKTSSPGTGVAPYTTSSRRVSRPPAPGRVTTRRSSTRSGTRLPSIDSSRSRASRAG